MNKPYDVVSFDSMGKLMETISSETIDEAAKKNEHFNYLDKYLTNLGAKTVIIESDYVDRDFLEDYSRYYSKCFKKYNKYCIRLHFFENKFNDREFFECISNYHLNRDASLLQDRYLGFIILRPLPKTLLGRICLKVYPQDEKSFFPVIRDYKVHILGIELLIKSLAFQEQDNAVSACATSAIWSALHGTEQERLRYVSSPYEITLNGKKLISDYAQSNFPNKGLLPSQMAHAIREEGLNPVLISFVNTSYLKALIRAYLNVKVPVVLGMKLRYEEEEGELPNGIPRSFPIGDHAVTVAGYHLTNDKVPEFSMKMIPSKIDKNIVKPLYLYSSKIDKIYVHDDQLGPFANMDFRNESWQHLATGWYHFPEITDQVNATINCILFPLYHKIRIRFNTIFAIINYFNACYTEIWQQMSGTQLIWDIFLTTVCELKKQIVTLDSDLICDENCKVGFLKYKMPRYIWVANAYIRMFNKESLSFSFYFDATDIDNSDLFICSLHYDTISFAINSEQAIKSTNKKIIGDHFSYYQSTKILSYYKNQDFEHIFIPEKSYKSMKELDDKYDVIKRV